MNSEKAYRNVSLYSNYCLIGKADSTDIIDASKDYDLKNGGYRLYVNPDSKTLAIWEYPNHVEPLLTMAEDFHSKGLINEYFVGGKISVFGSFLEKTEKAITYNFNIFPLSNMARLKNYFSTDSTNKSGELFLGLGNNILFIYPSQDWKQIEKIMEQRNRILGLSLIAYQPCKSPQKKSEYHAIMARASELNNQITFLINSCNAQLFSLSNAAKYLWTNQIQVNIQKITSELEDLAKQIKEIKKMVKSPSLTNCDVNPEIINSLWKIGQLLIYIKERYLLIDKTLNQRLSWLDNSISVKKSDLKIYGQMDLLTCLEYSIDDFLKSVDASSKKPFIVFEEKGPITYLFPSWNAESACFGTPLWYVYRFGLFPIFAHQVSHFFINKWTENNNLFNKLLFNISCEILDVIETNSIVDSLLTKNENGNQKKKQAVTITVETVADVIATLIAGPAYLQAFERLLIEMPSEISKLTFEMGDYSHLPPSIRIKLIQETLKYQKIFSNSNQKIIQYMNSKKVSNLISVLREFLFEIDNIQQTEFIEKKYTFEEHNTAISEVKDSLKQGLISFSRPTIILNALWDSVFDKEGYANEMAVVFSILNSKITS